MFFASKLLVPNFVVANKLINKTKVGVRKLITNDKQQVYNLLENHYPYSLQKYGIDDEYSKAYIRARARILLKANKSLGAFDISSNKLVGNIFNYVSTTTFAHERELYEEEGFMFTPKFDTLRRYWASNEERALKLLEVDKVLFWGLSVVHAEYRKFGVFFKLADKSISNLRHYQCKYGITLVYKDYFLTNLLIKKYKYNPLLHVRDIDYTDPKTNSEPLTNIPENDEIVYFLSKTNPTYSKI